MENVYFMTFYIVTCRTQLSNLEIMHIDAVKCLQRQVQQALTEAQVMVNAEFEATISARVSPTIVLKDARPACWLQLVDLGALCSRRWC